MLLQSVCLTLQIDTLGFERALLGWRSPYVSAACQHVAEITGQVVLKKLRKTQLYAINLLHFTITVQRLASFPVFAVCRKAASPGSTVWDSARWPRFGASTKLQSDQSEFTVKLCKQLSRCFKALMLCLLRNCATVLQPSEPNASKQVRLSCVCGHFVVKCVFVCCFPSVCVCVCPRDS